MYKNSKKLFISILFTSVYCCLLADNTPINITKIQSINEGGAKMFSVTISMQCTENIKTPWALGFYMPRTFNQLTTEYIDVNPDLNMTIVNDNTTKKSTELLYVNNKKGLNYSVGSTNILMPKDKFNLNKGNNYTIKLENSNQYGPGNLSTMPQSLFLITDFNINKPLKSTFIPIPTKPEAYSIGGYKQSDVEKIIGENVKKNIDESIQDTPLSDKYIIVPSPVKIKENSSDFVFDKGGLDIYVDDPLMKDNAEFLQSYLKEDLNISNVHVVSDKNNVNKNNSIVFDKLNDFTLINKNPEGYVLDINKNKIVIKAMNQTGSFYAIQTLRILINQNKETLILSGLKITDYPRFVYRGVMLDSARHFFSVEEVKGLVDGMAALKFNTLHFHLSDDEGWRLNLDTSNNGYKIGSMRGFSKGSSLTPQMFIQANLDISNYLNGHIIEKEYPSAKTLYKGTYDKKDILEIIDYANKRQITVIPEIDLPGHARALVYSYPKAFINPKDHSQYITVQGYFDDVIPIPLYNKNKLFTDTINNIINKIGLLFQDQTTIYAVNNEVSVGGDEVSPGAWTNDKSVSDDWKDLSALEKSQLFFKKLQKGTNTVISGWQQVIQDDDGGINPKITIPSSKTGHIWVWAPTGNEEEGGIAQAKILANSNYPVVLAFADQNYFDLTYTPDKWEPGYSWAGSFLDTNAALRSAVSSLKVQKALRTNKRRNILGLEGTLWSENIQNYRHLMYMAYPKMTGLSEAAWSPVSTTVNDEKVNWNSLVNRLGTDNDKFLGYLNKACDIIYRGYPHGISLESEVK